MTDATSTKALPDTHSQDSGSESTETDILENEAEEDGEEQQQWEVGILDLRHLFFNSASGDDPESQKIVSARKCTSEEFNALMVRSGVPFDENGIPDWSLDDRAGIISWANKKGIKIDWWNPSVEAVS